MTHSLVLEVPENIYQPLAEEAEAKGRKIEDVAIEILELMTTDRQLSSEEFEKMSDLLAGYVEVNLSLGAQPLSDYAMSREGIYENHP